jgi:hypothetical protein|tara:strand:- start:40 stop:294 length:255 start_codon:yes stop_codon:yes gene_type:complete
MLIFYPQLNNGNILWTCDDCGNTAEVSCADTNAVALVCICDGEVHPQCNNDWYYKGLYWDRIPMNRRMEYRKERSKKYERNTKK